MIYSPAFVCKQREILMNLFRWRMKLLCLFPIILLTLPSFSQSSIQDTSKPLFESLYKQYIVRVGGASNLYNGAEYEGSYPLVQGSPFWNNIDFQNGAICYGGIVYYDVPIAYELVRNEVLIKGFQQLTLRLDKQRIAFFNLAGHTFVHLAINTSLGYSPPDDFYDLLYDNVLQLYAKRVKRVERALRSENPDQIISTATYFLYKDKQYYPIAVAKDLLHIFPQEKNSIQSFWKERKLNFKADPEQVILQTISFWLQIKK